MARTQFYDVLNGQSVVPPGPLLDSLETRIVYVVQRNEDPTTLTPGAVTAIYYRDVTFEYDATDATSVHDGLTVLVTADGKRFKADGYKGRQTATRSVLDKDLTTPPGSPSLGDAYIVAAAATGDWAGQDKAIAEYTARGWVFHPPERWDTALVEDETAYYHHDAASNWVLGLPGSTIAAGSIGIAQQKYGLGVAVQSATVNTPPGSPTEGVAYIVGPSPTGAWVGQAGNLAIYEGAAWIFYTPMSGWTVFNLATDRLLIYKAGTGWIDPLLGSAGICVKRTFAASAITGNTAYTTGNIISANHAALAVGNLLEITLRMRFYVEDGSGGGVSSEQIDFRVDSETDARNMVFSGPDGGDSAGPNIDFATTVFVTAADTASHLYRFRPRNTNAGIVALADLSGTAQTQAPQMLIKEYA